MSDDDEFEQAVKAIAREISEQEQEIYSQEVIEEFRNPSNIGRLVNADGEGIVHGTCGDTMEIYVKHQEGIITECAFFTDGCGASIACGSRLTKLVLKQSLRDANQISPEDLIRSLDGLPEENEHCAILAVLALRESLKSCLREIYEPPKERINDDFKTQKLEVNDP